MALTTRQITELDALNKRISTGYKPSQADLDNLAYAKKQGYAYKPTVGINPPAAPVPLSPAPPQAPVAPAAAPKPTAPNIGLQAALDRETKGTATVTDKENLAYARSKGTIPAATAPSKSNISPERRAGLDVASRRISEGKGTATDIANVNYAKSKLGYTPQQEIEQINQDANRNQDSELALIEDEAGRNVDLTTSEGLVNRLADILQDEERRQSEEPSITQKVADERAKLGVGELETNLTNLDAELKQLDATHSSTEEQEETRQVGIGAIRRRQDAVNVEYNRQRRDLVAERDSVANQLNQKYAVINTMVTTTNMDIDNARQDYQTRFNSAITMINLVKGIEQDQKNDAERKADNARANAQIMYNLIKEGNVSYDDMTEAQKLDIKNMEIAAGLPVGFVGYLANTVQEPIVHFGSEFTNAAGERVQPITIIDKATGNLSTKIISLGRAKPEGGGGYQPPSSYQEWVLAGKESGTGKTYAQYLSDRNAGDPTDPTEAQTLRKAQTDMAEMLNSKKGSDGYVSPWGYKQARSGWIANGYSSDDFFNNFRIYVNPVHYKDYGIEAVQWNT